jgi:hypothetical protein
MTRRLPIPLSPAVAAWLRKCRWACGSKCFQTLFCAIQHPGEGSTLDQPISSWPDGTVPRPSVIAIGKPYGDPRIGS